MGKCGKSGGVLLNFLYRSIVIKNGLLLFSMILVLFSTVVSFLPDFPCNFGLRYNTPIITGCLKFFGLQL
jgi:hypothetical protein